MAVLSSHLLPPLSLLAHCHRRPVRLDESLQLLCLRGAISPCNGLARLNQGRTTQSTTACQPPSHEALAAAVRKHALADIQLHALATARFEHEWTNAFGSRPLLSPH